MVNCTIFLMQHILFSEWLRRKRKEGGFRGVSLLTCVVVFIHPHVDIDSAVGESASRRRRDEGPIHDIDDHEDQDIEEDFSDKLVGKYPAGKLVSDTFSLD
jgi:hypothetical protein